MTVQEKYLKIADDVIAAGPYKPDWHSLAAYEAPKWFRNAKFGIFIHWGISAYPPIIMNGIPVTCIFRTWKNGMAPQKLWGTYEIWI